MARKIAQLFASLNSVTVDEAAGTIRNCAVMTAGPTIGHPFAIDATTLSQTADLINAAGGVKCRFKHPGQNGDSIQDDAGMVVGKLLAPVRMENGQIRGDIEIGDYARTLPGYGDARAYLLGIAQANPEAIGLSVVMVWEPEMVGGQPMARVSDVMACDFVGKPAANPNGLLAAGSNSPEIKTATVGMSPTDDTNRGTAARKNVMSAKLKAMLVALGCDPKSTDEQFKSYMEAMPTEQQGMLSALAADPKEPDGDETPDEAKKEEARMSAIVNLGKVFMTTAAKLGKVAELEAAIDASTVSGHSPAQARVAMLKAIETKAPEIKPTTGDGTHIRVGEDANCVSMLAAIPDSIRLRAGLEVKGASDRAAMLGALPVVDQARHFLAMLGVADVWNMSRARVAELALSPKRLMNDYPRVAMLAQSTSDFPYLLANAITKQVLQDYRAAESQWPKFCRKGFVPDFKTAYRTGLSDASPLVERKEGGTVQYAAIGERGESVQVVEYIGGLRFTRKAMVNDDLNQLSRIPQLIVIPAKALEDTAAFAVLSGNANMADGVPLCHATHANLVTTPGNEAPSLASVKAMVTLMAKQKAPKGLYLDIFPKFAIVPADIAAEAMQFFNSTILMPTALGSTSAKKLEGTSNPYAGRFEVISSSRLSTVSAAAWYMLADFRQGVDTIEMVFLQDEPEPVVRQETDFDTEDVKIAVRHSVAAKAVEYRGIVANPGQ